jgi:hypothetical protein
MRCQTAGACGASKPLNPKLVAPQVQKVTEAVALVKQKRPGLKVEGPIQYDAAIDPAVAAVKIKGGSDVAGKVRPSQPHGKGPGPGGRRRGAGQSLAVAGRGRRLWSELRTQRPSVAVKV